MFNLARFLSEYIQRNSVIIATNKRSLSKFQFLLSEDLPCQYVHPRVILQDYLPR